MVNEERLRHMIKMSRFDTNDGEECRPMTQYARTDYVSLKMLGSFVTGTVCYGLILGIWALYSAESLLEGINSMDIRAFLLTLLLSYILFMLFYLGATYIVFNMKYTRGRRKIKKFYSNLKKVNQMYEREERLKSTDNKGWE